MPGRIGAVHLFAAAVLAALIASLLFLNGGTFSYTLDDAYIHLALSEGIRAGAYGINPGEYASPSSSILFPFLLAVGAATPLHHYVPLILNVAALAATIEILRRFVRRVGFERDRYAMRAGAILLAAFLLAFNLIGLTLTGMEHNIHVALTCAVVLGLIVFLEDGRLTWWFVVCLIAAPLVRYEGVPLSLVVTLVIAWRGRVKAALLIGAAIVASVGLFSWFLVSHGQGILPASVLVKSSLTGMGVDRGLRAMLAPFKRNVHVNALTPPGALLIAAGLTGSVLFVRGVRRDPGGAAAIVAGVLAAFAWSHVLFGRFGWFARYEIYAMVGAALMLVYLARQRVRVALETRAGTRRLTALGLAAMVLAGSSYIYATLQAPIGSNNMFEQQYQMHRFLTEVYRKPAAVNDLGWTSFRNEAYIFDLWGLGSEESRRTAMNDDLEVMDRLVQQRGIALAIIYPDWFTAMPDTWVPLAEMSITRARVSAGRATVRFYATRPDAAGRIRADLRTFAGTLPPRLRLDFIPPAAAGR